MYSWCLQWFPEESKFPKLQIIGYVNEVFPNLFQQILAVTDYIAPCKTKRFKANTKKWFNGDTEKQNTVHLKRNDRKKWNTFDDNSPNVLENQKDFGKPLNFLSMTKKKSISNFNAVESNN